MRKSIYKKSNMNSLEKEKIVRYQTLMMKMNVATYSIKYYSSESKSKGLIMKCGHIGILNLSVLHLCSTQQRHLHTGIHI